MSDISIKLKTEFINNILGNIIKNIDNIENIELKFKDSHFWCFGKIKFITFQFKGQIDIIAKNIFIVELSLLKFSKIRLPRIIILKNAIRFINKKINYKGIELKVSGKKVMINCQKLNIPIIIDKINLKNKFIEIGFSVLIKKILKLIMEKNV